MHILEIDLLTDDINQTTGFYNSHLGFKILTHTKSEVSFLAGTSVLKFKRSANLNPVYHFAFNINHTWLNEAFEWLQDRVEILEISPGVKIADFANWNAKSIYFKDNNGNILEFIARYDIDAPAGVTGIDAIQCVSEIGVVSDNVTSDCNQLIPKYNIPVFSKQPRFDNFTALGDDNGLFIFSSTNRHWYPTDIKAEKYPVRVVISNNGVEAELRFNN